MTPEAAQSGLSLGLYLGSVGGARSSVGYAAAASWLLIETVIHLV